jgi:hypothetical protein
MTQVTRAKLRHKQVRSILAGDTYVYMRGQSTSKPRKEEGGTCLKSGRPCVCAILPVTAGNAGRKGWLLQGQTWIHLHVEY